MEITNFRADECDCATGSEGSNPSLTFKNKILQKYTVEFHNKIREGFMNQLSLFMNIINNIMTQSSNRRGRHRHCFYAHPGDTYLHSAFPSVSVTQEVSLAQGERALRISHWSDWVLTEK